MDFLFYASVSPVLALCAICFGGQGRDTTFKRKSGQFRKPAIFWLLGNGQELVRETKRNDFRNDPMMEIGSMRNENRNRKLITFCVLWVFRWIFWRSMV